MKKIMIHFLLVTLCSLIFVSCQDHTFREGKIFAGGSLTNRPLLLLGVLLMVIGLQVLTTGLLAEMITSKSFRSSETYSIRELLR